MPGLTLSIGEREQYEKYMDAAAEAIRQFINKEPVTVPIYEIEQPDSLLWATWCLQQYRKNVSAQDFQERYGELLKDIMEYVRGGHHTNLFVHENGLLYSNGRDRAVTWMNSMANGRPIIPRSGYIVEFNALWYNAMKFYEQVLKEKGDETSMILAQDYADEAEKMTTAFKEVFLNEHGSIMSMAR